MRVRGYTLIELITVLGIVAILTVLSVAALSNLKATVARQSMAADMFSELSSARNRARAREHAQIFVFDAVGGSNTTYGFYHFEDTASPPAILGTTTLSTLVTAMTDPPTVPGGYSLRLLESRTSSTNGFYMNSNAWNGALPFPWTSLATSTLDTTGGCSFCTTGKGALAFLPSGRVVFANGNTSGGFLVIAGDAGTGTSVRTGIGISPTGFVQQVEHP